MSEFAEDLVAGLEQLWEDVTGEDPAKGFGWLQAYTSTKDKARREETRTPSGVPIQVRVLEMAFALDDIREVEVGDRKLVILPGGAAGVGIPAGTKLDQDWRFSDTQGGQERPLVGPIIAQKPGGDVIWWEAQLRTGGSHGPKP